jgi:hypothetical protein
VNLDLNDIPPLITFTLSALFITWLSGRQKHAEDMLRQTRGELEVRVHERTIELQQLNDVLRAESAERKRAEETRARLNRTLQTLYQCDQALVHATDEDDLVQSTCRILVEVGGLRMAWVGYRELDTEKTVRPVAQAGDEQGYLESVNVT